MSWKVILLLLNLSVATTLMQAAAPLERFHDFEKRAAQFKSIVALPPFEQSTNALHATVDGVIRSNNQALDRVGATQPAQASFALTVGALDDIAFEINLVANRFSVIKETSPRADLRDAATDELKRLQEWMVGLDYREDVYAAVKTYADTHPRLNGEDARLLDQTLRDYRRAGLSLPKDRRNEVERMRKELSGLTTDFEANINKAQKAVKFTRAELEGVPEDFVQSHKTGENEFTVMANRTTEFIRVMDNAKLEATRKRLLVEHDNLARVENLPLLEKILLTRDGIAKRLGYQNWADYQTEVKMAKNGATAIDFLQKLKVGLQPKFDAELAEFRRLKVKESGQADAQIHLWDARYFSNQLKKEKYTIDAEQLRVYFPYQRVLDGLFAIYQNIFGLKFEAIEPPYKWVDDLQLYSVADAKTGQPLGLFYLDMFPREGKFNHFAQFGLIDGKRLPDGKYQRPTVALVCNFPPPTPDHPSLLAHSDVETLFHEFGHAMHSILTRANHVRFSGSSVPRDFVEAPSQMLENWVWDKRVLDSFAGDYRDPSKKIPAQTLAKLREAKLGIEGSRYRRQLSLGLTDLVLHTQIHEGSGSQVLPLSNKILSDVYLPMAPDTAFVAYFGHLMGYDAGYYGYAWADAIAADMATIFERAPNGYFDRGAGRRLRTEIYETGDSRDVNTSIEKFLGRPRSIEPFLKKLGIENKN